MTGIVINMPRRILDAYHEWFLYINGLGPARSAPFQDVEFFRVAHVGMVILVGIMALTCLIRKIRQDGNKKCIIEAAFIILLFLALPLASNVALLLAPDSGGVDVHMAMPMAMYLPAVAGIVMFTSEDKGRNKKAPGCWLGAIALARMFSALLLAFTLYGSFLMVSVDQYVMQAGRDATISLLQRIAADLEQRGYTDSHDGKRYVFIGRPADNIMFQKCDLWDYANRYAKYGDILVGGDATIQSYMGLMEECGVNFTISYWDYPEWNRMEQNPEVAAMPEYPKEGYLKTIGDNIVIKVAQ